MYFIYGEEETAYLKAKDKRLGEVIDQIGHINRLVTPDLFTAVVEAIVGQQISAKVQETILDRMRSAFGKITPQKISEAADDELRSFGLSLRKVTYIKDLAAKILSGEFKPERIAAAPDAEAIKIMTELKGVGVWTAEMMLLFCLQRPDILSYDDFGIRRGMRMVYHHRNLTRQLFAKYRRRLSPYGSVASLYFWAVAGGAIPGLRDLGK